MKLKDPCATLKTSAPALRAVLALCGALVLAATAGTARGALPLVTNASGVFVNERGDILTARHAVANCRSLYAVKDGQVSLARVLAVSEAQDIAVIGTTLRPYLTATFAHAVDDSKGGRPVYAESYEVLQATRSARGTLFNALTVPGGGLSLLSPVRPGASGSAVLDAGGLDLGMVVERVAVSGSAGATALSAGGAYPSMEHAGASRVKAVPVSEITGFMRAHGIPFTESDVPQLESTQAVGPRATTLAAGIICG
jgi:serine protease DegQ